EPAVHHLAHQPLLAVERVHQHAVAALPAVHAAADFNNLARDIEPDDHGHGHLDAGHAAHREDIVIVERGRLDPDHDVVVDDGRVGEVLYQLQLFQPAVLFKYYRLHRLLRLKCVISEW